MNTSQNPWLSARDLLPTTGLRLFCLPHAGSGAAGFFRWKRLLPAGIEVCPVLLPGREMRLAEASCESAESLVAELVRWMTPLLKEPYALFGHSMGALLAYEWARQARAAGLPAPRVLFVSGRGAPHRPFPHRRLHQLEDDAFVEALRLRYGGIPDGLLSEPDLREVFLPILRADLTVVETYDPGEFAQLDCPILAVAGSEDANVSDADLAAWGELTDARAGSMRLPGDHFYHLGSGQQALLASMVEWLIG